jgi:hypothetical protein
MFHWLDYNYPGSNQQLAANQVVELEKVKSQKYLYVYKHSKEGIFLGFKPHPATNMFDTVIIGKIKMDDVL